VEGTVPVNAAIFTTEPPAVAHQSELWLASSLSAIALAKVEGHRERLNIGGMRGCYKGDGVYHGDRRRKAEEAKTGWKTNPPHRHSGHHAQGVMSRNPDVSVVKLLNRDEGDTVDKSQSSRGK